MKRTRPGGALNIGPVRLRIRLVVTELNEPVIGQHRYARQVDLESVRKAFENPPEFSTSPLYRTLSRTVAASDQLLGLAARGRPGQYPTFLFFGAVQLLLLRGADHPLARYFPSVAGAQVLPADEAGPALVSFGAEFAPELAEIISTRLVQTSHVQRALALRLGMSMIAPAVTGPVHLIEVGPGAGFLLRFDRYGYRIAGRQYGDPASPVQLTADVYGTAPLPDLDVLPRLASVQGIDLHPVDVQDPAERAWLEALVWPENQAQRALLASALEGVAADPPRIRAGDAIDVLPQVGQELPAGSARVVFHAAARLHVPRDRRGAFDAAIRSLSDTGPLWWLSVEDPPRPDPRPQPARHGVSLLLRTPDGRAENLAVADGHVRWIEMLRGPLTAS